MIILQWIGICFLVGFILAILDEMFHFTDWGKDRK